MPMRIKERTNEAKWLEKEGRWYIQIMRGGILRRFYSTIPGRKGKIDAEKQADEWIASGLRDGSVKIDDLFARFIGDMRKNDLYTTQYAGYGRLYILPEIGDRRIGTIREQDLQEILTNQYLRGLSKHTLQNIRGCISSFMRFCRASGYTDLRPELLRVNKKAPCGKKRSMQPDELRILFSSEDTLLYKKKIFDWYIYAYRFLVTTGMRPGEMCGLRWQDISEDGTVSICESYNNDRQMTTGKNENARRTFSLNEEAIRALEGQKRLLKEMSIVSPWVFPRQIDGEISTQQKILRSFHKFCEYHMIPHTTLYELRHTYVSVNKEMPTELLKSQVGHSESMRTLDVYGHELKGERERAAAYSTEAFRSILGNDLPETREKPTTNTSTKNQISQFSNQKTP